MTSQPGQQTMAIQTSHKAKTISWLNITREIFFFKTHAENETGRQVSDFFLFFEKALYEVVCRLNFNIFW